MEAARPRRVGPQMEADLWAIFLPQIHTRGKHICVPWSVRFPSPDTLCFSGFLRLGEALGLGQMPLSGLFRRGTSLRMESLMPADGGSLVAGDSFSSGFPVSEKRFACMER